MRWIQLRETGQGSAPRTTAASFADNLRQRLNIECEVVVTPPNADGIYFVGLSDSTVAAVFTATCRKYGIYYIVRILR